MDINDSPKVIAETLGRRLKQARLNANFSQQALAVNVGLSKNTIISAEAGKTKLETLIAIMQGLDLLDQLSLFLAEPAVSPLQLALMKGVERKRASKSKIVSNNDKSNESEPEW